MFRSWDPCIQPVRPPQQLPQPGVQQPPADTRTRPPLQPRGPPPQPQVIRTAAKVPTTQEEGGQVDGRVPAPPRAQQRGRSQVAGEGKDSHPRHRGAGQDPGPRERPDVEEG